MMFNAYLEKKVRNSKVLTWLNIINDMVVIGEDAYQHLRSDLKLDGTHLSPSYVKSVLSKQL
jgi:hypothetical protein